MASSSSHAQSGAASVSAAGSSVPERDDEITTLLKELHQFESVFAGANGPEHSGRTMGKIWDELHHRWWAVVKSSQSTQTKDWPAFICKRFGVKFLDVLLTAVFREDARRVRGNAE